MAPDGISNKEDEMAILKHTVYDTDTHFSIDPITRALKNETCPKSVLIQNDHNSERFTFEMPRIIEGHDMSKCNVVQVHYLNVDVQTKEQSSGVYTVDDLSLSPDSEDVVICSWLISQNATKHTGDLRFLLRFSCVEEGVVLYAWNTGIHTNISVSAGIYNGDAFDTEYVDIIEQWKENIIKGFLEDAEVAIADWKETESANIRAVMTEFGEGWNDILDVERARISAHIAMSDDGQQITHEIDGGSKYKGNIKYNGVVALIEFAMTPTYDDPEVFKKGSYREYEAIPPELAPLMTTTLFVVDELYETQFTASVIPPRKKGGKGIVRIDCIREGLAFSQYSTVAFTGKYYNNEPVLAELYDTRVGYDGTIHDTAGDAIRQQVRAAQKAVELSKQNVFEHSWDGTVLKVKSAIGESSANLRGETGAKGIRGESGQPRVVSEAIATGTVSVELENNTEYRFFTPLTSLTINKIIRGESVTTGYVDIEYIGFFPTKNSASAFDITQYTGDSEHIYTADQLEKLVESGAIRGKNMTFETHIEDGRKYLRAIPTLHRSLAIEWTLSDNNICEETSVAVIGAKSNVIGKDAAVGLPMDDTFDFTKEYLRVGSSWAEKTDGVSRTKHIFDMSSELSSSGIEEYRFFKFYPWNGNGILIDAGLSEQWCVIFTAAKSGISVAFPDETDIIWAVTEPTFIAGYTYYLSFIPFGDKLIGVWASKELA